VDLDASTLQDSGVDYRNVSNTLSFRLEVYPSESTSVSESIQATADRIPMAMPPKPAH
jgi:hypothetical protein